MPAATRAPSKAEVEAVAAAGGDVVLRNLRITRSYHDLARAIAGMVGAENANWCVFATWASKTAGRFIRLRDVRAELERRLADAGPLARFAIDRIDRRLAAARARHPSLADYLGAVLAETSGEVMRGNLRVYSELAPLFAAMLAELGADASFASGRLDAFVARLAPGPTEAGGQDPLRDAVSRIVRARFESDPKRKAEHLLAANALVGMHEQLRLQPHIAASIDAPVAEGVRRIVRELKAALPRGPRGWPSRALLTLLAPLAAQAVAKRWREVVTRALMTLELPGGTLRLGEDVPALPGQPPFPAALAAIDDPELRALLARHGAAGAALSGSRAADWTAVADRLRYIFDLFRARQQDASLFTPPFTPPQDASLAAGRVPDGDL